MRGMDDRLGRINAVAGKGRGRFLDFRACWLNSRLRGCRARQQLIPGGSASQSRIGNAQSAGGGLQVFARRRGAYTNSAYWEPRGPWESRAIGRGRCVHSERGIPTAEMTSLIDHNTIWLDV